MNKKKNYKKDYKKNKHNDYKPQQKKKHYDKNTTLYQLRKYVTKYRNQEQLDTQDSISELIKAINIESSELLETTLFGRGKSDHKSMTRELADILIYSLALADKLEVDITTIINHKIRYNNKRGRKYHNKKKEKSKK